MWIEAWLVVCRRPPGSHQRVQMATGIPTAKEIHG